MDQVAVSAAVDVSPGEKIAQSADLSTVMIDLGERARDEVRGRAAREVHRHLPGMTVGELPRSRRIRAAAGGQ